MTTRTPSRAAIILLLAANCDGVTAKWAADAGVRDATEDAIIDQSSDDTVIEGNEAQADAGEAPDVAGDQSAADGTDSPLPACDPTAPFGAPMLLPGPNVNATAEQGGSRLTSDELNVYFSSRHRPGGTDRSDLFVAHRTSVSDAFGPAIPLPTLDSNADEFDPAIAGLSIFFMSYRDDGGRSGGVGGTDLWVATRPSLTSDDFSPPTNLGAPVDSPFDEAQPYLRADGTELWFTSTGKQDGQFHIYRSVRSSQPAALFGPPEQVTELASPNANDLTPTVSANGLVIFFASTRAGGLGYEDIWTASRAQVTAPFSNLSDVSVLNSGAADYPTWLSPDGCRLYLSSRRRYPTMDEAIYVAVRGK